MQASIKQLYTYNLCALPPPDFFSGSTTAYLNNIYTNFKQPTVSILIVYLCLLLILKNECFDCSFFLSDVLCLPISTPSLTKYCVVLLDFKDWNTLLYIFLNPQFHLLSDKMLYL